MEWKLEQQNQSEKTSADTPEETQLHESANPLAEAQVRQTSGSEVGKWGVWSLLSPCLEYLTWKTTGLIPAERGRTSTKTLAHGGDGIAGILTERGRYLTKDTGTSGLSARV